ncbi:hypothetical protein FE633_11860 [Streptomyces montanus]|uniref:YceI family protein n=1 Tax=Streptomyces montanus TaxID=2580423 RepID=A0A5R9FR62_9ACTN|nr:hypothetical protein [Streptomyces montanus]TLS45851.1 hypothetical protein FE633_11860 [Streptomyces montanus]
MTTVTLPAVPPPPPDSDDNPDPSPLPLPGRYAVAPGRSLVELTAFYGPFATRRRRVLLTGAALTIPKVQEVQEVQDAQTRPSFRFVLGSPLRATLTSEHVELLDHGRRLRLTGDLELRGVAFPVLLRLRVVERADDRLLVVGTARLPYRLLRRATGFRWPRLCPASRLRLLIAGEFA